MKFATVVRVIAIGMFAARQWRPNGFPHAEHYGLAEIFTEDLQIPAPTGRECYDPRYGTASPARE